MKAIKEFFKGDQFAARNNIELLEAGNGNAKAKMTLHPHHWNGLGTVHGGAIFTLADLPSPPRAIRTGRWPWRSTSSITFMKAATTGTLWADGREVSKNFKVGAYAVEIKDDQGELVAQFQGLAYRKKDKLPFAPPENK